MVHISRPFFRKFFSVSSGDLTLVLSGLCCQSVGVVPFNVRHKILLHHGNVLADVALLGALGRELLTTITQLGLPLLLGLLRDLKLLLDIVPIVVTRPSDCHLLPQSLHHSYGSS